MQLPLPPSASRREFLKQSAGWLSLKELKLSSVILVVFFLFFFFLVTDGLWNRQVMGLPIGFVSSLISVRSLFVAVVGYPS